MKEFIQGIIQGFHDGWNSAKNGITFKEALALARKNATTGKS